MSILVHIGLPDWMRDDELRDILVPMLPEVTIHCGPPQTVLYDVVMLALSENCGDVWPYVPNLELVQKLGAGVNQIVDDPNLPAHVRVARLAPDLQADEIAEYCLAHVLRHQRNMPFHETQHAARRWTPAAPKRTDATTVGVLGLGHIGARTARLFSQMRFRTLGWSRSQKSIDGVDCHAGPEALGPLLTECDYVVSILPSTPETQDLLDSTRFAEMKPGAVLINVGRGDLIVEGDLIDALDNGPLGGAVLDVFRTEPLDPGDPLWRHPGVTVTPHVSGWHLDGGFEDAAENYRRLLDGRPLLHEVDRTAGY